MTTKEKLIETIHEIPEEKLSELLKVVENFKNKNKTNSAPDKWDRYLGIISDEDAEAMLAVIKEEAK